MIYKEKDNRTPEEWLSVLNNKVKLSALDKVRINGIKHVIAGTKTGGSNRYVAWAQVNKWRTVDVIKEMPRVDIVELTTVGQTAYNRKIMNIGKVHHFNALEKYCKRK